MEIIINLTNPLYPDDKNLLALHEELSQDRQIIPYDTIWRRTNLFLPNTTWGILDTLARGLQIYHVSSHYLRLIHNTNCLFLRVCRMENTLRIFRAKKYYIRKLPQPIAEEIEENFDDEPYVPSCGCCRLEYFSGTLYVPLSYW